MARPIDRGNAAGRLEDEQRKHEVQPLVDGEPVVGRDDRRLQESSGDGEPTPDPGLRPLTATPAGGEPSIDQAIIRADFARWLEPSSFPADRADILRSLEDNHSPAWVRAAAAHARQARYGTIGELWDDVGEVADPPAAH